MIYALFWGKFLKYWNCVGVKNLTNMMSGVPTFATFSVLSSAALFWRMYRYHQTGDPPHLPSLQSHWLWTAFVVKCLEKPLLVVECPFSALLLIWGPRCLICLLWQNFDMTFAMIYLCAPAIKQDVNRIWQIELNLTLDFSRSFFYFVPQEKGKGCHSWLWI